jgi:hypothetical protein
MDRRPEGEGRAAGRRTARRAVASYSTYREAERAVDYLADHDFPVDHVTIIGRDLRFVEQVTGRMGVVEAMARGAFSGALAGFLLGWLFAVFGWLDPVLPWGWVMFDGTWFGAAVGALVGLLGHLALRGARDFASKQRVEAKRYEVLVDSDVADEAVKLLTSASPPLTGASVASGVAPTRA